MEKIFFVALNSEDKYYQLEQDTLHTYISVADLISKATKYDYIDDIYQDKIWYSENEVDVVNLVEGGFQPVRIQEVKLTYQVLNDVDFKDNKYLDEV